MGIGDVPYGSEAEFRQAVGLDDALMPVDNPAVDKAFQLMRGGNDKDESNDKKVVALVTTKSDEQRAAELKAELRVAAEAVCAVFTVARQDNILLSWEMGWDPAGRAFVQTVNSMKPL